MKWLLLLVLLFTLTGCLESPDTLDDPTGGPSGQRMYQGHPIDCLEEGVGTNWGVLSCDFVAWHQKWDEAR